MNLKTDPPQTDSDRGRLLLKIQFCEEAHYETLNLRRSCSGASWKPPAPLPRGVHPTQQTSSSNLLLSESDRRRFSLTFAPPRGCLQTCIWCSFRTYGNSSCVTESDRHELFRTFAIWLFAFLPGSPSATGPCGEKRSCVHVARWCRSDVRSWIDVGAK